MSSVAQRISGTLLATAALFAIAALTGPMAARLLGPDGRGNLAAIQLWPGALAMVAMVGLPDAIVYFGAREPNRAGQWLFMAQLIALAATCVAVGVGYQIVSAVLRNYDPDVIWAAHLYLLIVPLTALIGLPCQMARALGRFGLWNILRIMPGLGWLAILLVFSMGRSISPTSVALAYLGFLGVAAVATMAVCVTVFPAKGWFSRPAAMKLIKYGAPAGLSAVPQFLNLRLDQLLIATFLSPAALGLYVVAVSWSGISAVAVSALGPVIFQRIAAEHDVTHARALLCQATRATVIVTMATSVAFALLTPVSMAVLYGDSFRASVPTALILVGAGAIAMTNGVVEDGLRGLGDTRAILYAELIGLVGTASSLALLLSPLGIAGAAVASVVGYSAVTAGLAFALRRHDVVLRDAFVPRVSDAKTIVRMAGASWPANWRLGASPAI